MAVAQPALLYLVPCTLIPVFLLGLIRREWRLLWEGDSQVCLFSLFIRLIEGFYLFLLIAWKNNLFTDFSFFDLLLADRRDHPIDRRNAS
jgi:hypothetical protein